MKKKLIYSLRTTAAVAGLLAVAILFASPALSQTPTSNMALLKQQYGITSSPLQFHDTYTVGTSATRIAKNDPARVEIVVVNLSSNNCYVQNGNTASTSSGFELTGGGGTITEDFRSDLTLPTTQVWAVCSAASSKMYVLEVDLQ